MSIVLNYWYPFLVTAFAVLIYFIFFFKLKKAEYKKIKSLKKRNINDAVETESPLDNYEKSIKAKGMSVTENRFSFFKKALPLILFSLWSLFISLPYLGKVPTVYISIIAAIVSVLAGFALRPFLENLFAGVVISFSKSVKIGDTVIIDGHYGLIEEIGLTYSVLKEWNWGRVVLPNSKLLNTKIENLTMSDTYIWAYVEFFVSPKTDLGLVESVAKSAAKQSKFMADVEDPSFWVMALEKDTIKCWVAAWALNPSDAWELRNDMRTKLAFEFQKQNIECHQMNINPMKSI